MDSLRTPKFILVEQAAVVEILDLEHGVVRL